MQEKPSTGASAPTSEQQPITLCAQCGHASATRASECRWCRERERETRGHDPAQLAFDFWREVRS